MNASLAAALDALVDRYLDATARKYGSLPRQEYDPAWPSPCQIGEPDATNTIRWQPVRRTEAPDFSGLENALEVAIHEDVKTYYGRYWSDVLETTFPDGGLSLIQVWNEADFDRLIENLVGHAFAKQRVRAPLTVFFACTDEGEYFLSVDNETGRVVLEAPGEPPAREVAPSLAEFLRRLEPAV